jgi:hypothetical protein
MKQKSAKCMWLSVCDNAMCDSKFTHSHFSWDVPVKEI